MTCLAPAALLPFHLNLQRTKSIASTMGADWQDSGEQLKMKTLLSGVVQISPITAKLRLANRGAFAGKDAI